MKHLTLIIHTSAQQDMADRLRSLEQVEGHQSQGGDGELL